MKSKQTLGISIILVLLVAALLFQLGGDTLAAPSRPADLPREPRPSDLQPALPTASSQFWASDWVAINPGDTITLDHNLGGDPDDYAVQLWFRDTDIGGYGVHTRGYGGLEDNGQYSGANWQDLTASHIRVFRRADDTLADQVRVWIWVPELLLEYCTPWSNINKGETVTVNHNLGGNVDDYVVGLWFKANPPLGINQKGYGGMEAETEWYGAYWYNLTTTEVSVYRQVNDSSVDQFRLCVGVGDPPDYDSGWVGFTPGQTRTLTHALGGNPGRYIVRMEFKDLPPLYAPYIFGYGIHNRALGGDASNTLLADLNHLGASWQKLTSQTIDVQRWENDTWADQIRVRIWQRRVRVYLPMVLRNYP